MKTTIFAALVPSEDTNESAMELRISMINKFKKELGAIIYTYLNDIYMVAIFKNNIVISMHTDKFKNTYWILQIEVYYCNDLTANITYCRLLEYPCLNLHKIITTKFYQFCMMVFIKTFNLRIANNILSFIDFKDLFIPLQWNRCACISPTLLFNVMKVLSNQDIKNTALNDVICELVLLTNSCYAIRPMTYREYCQQSEMELWVLSIHSPKWILSLSTSESTLIPLINTNACNLYNPDFDEDKITLWKSKEKN
jgi:hypothetical protein